MQATMPTPLAADPSGLPDLAGVFLQFGVVGVVALLGIMFAKGAHQRERDRADRAEAENRELLSQMRDRDRADKAEAEARRLQDLVIEQVIPALGSATHAAQENAELLRLMQRERELAMLTRRRDPEGGQP